MDIHKLANLYEQKMSHLEGLFGNTAYHKDVEHLALLAGKLKFKASKETNEEKANELSEIARLVLLASDLLKKV